MSRKRRCPLSVITLAAWLALAVLVPRAAEAQTLPSGFVDETVIGGLNEGTAFAFLPDGRVLIAEKSGLVRVLKNGALLTAPFIDLRSRVNAYWDRGLVGMAADPNFASNGFVYFYYVFENDPNTFSGPKTARLTRVTASGDTAPLTSEVVLIGNTTVSSCSSLPAGADCIPADGAGHNGGAIRFAAGTIFLAVGDSASWTVVDDNALRAQDLDVLAGKLLRVTTSGAGLSSNPFWTGNASANRSKIWAYGFRNPFRFGIRPTSGTPYLGDVGWETWEEVNVVSAGGNFGWPCYEGNARQSGYEPKAVCQSLYAAGTQAVRLPLVAYDHITTSAVVGGAFYTGTTFPSAYQGAYFYGDYARGMFWSLQTDATDSLVGSVQTFGTGVAGPVDIQMGPDGNLYYLAINTGEFHRIRYDTTAPPPSYLTDRQWTSATNGWGPPEVDMSNGEAAAGDGRVITLNGVAYLRGLGVHANSDVRYSLGGVCSTFVSDVGVDDEVGSVGSVVFEVWADNVRLAATGPMTGSSATARLTVDVSGRQELSLRVTDAGDGIDYDHADWAGALLSCGSGSGGGGGGGGGTTTRYLSDMTWTTMTNGWGPVELDQSNGEQGINDGRTMTLQGQTYAKGLGAHADSNVTYALDGTCSTFLADIGVDDEVGSNGSVIFEVWTDGVKAFGGALMNGTTATAQVNVDVTNRTQLSLRVLNGGDGIDFDHADWAGARLVCGGTGTGTTAPVATIAPPAASLRYKVGDVITYSGSATDAEDGTIPGSGLAWNILIHHCPGGTCHLHQFLTNTGAGGSFTVPDHGDDSYFELILTATDSGGLTASASRAIQPLTAQLTLQTSPSGLQLVYGGTSGTSPMVRTPVVGSTVTVYAPSPQNGATFQSWSDGGAQQHNVTVNGDLVLTATFVGATAPVVTSTSPPASATNVNANVTVTATFSTPMASSTINTATFFLVPQGGTSPVAASVAYDAASRTASLKPAGRLASGTVYTATIRGGSSGVKDSGGTAMQADVVWSFTVRGKR